MQCADAWPLLDLLCDSALEAKDCALVLDHLKSCDGCQREWSQLELLRSSFRDAKGKYQSPAGLMQRISETLTHDERYPHVRFFEQWARTVLLVAVAATFALIGLTSLPSIHRIDTRSAAMQTASADTLAEAIDSVGALEPLTDRAELAKRLGYDLKYVQIPDWQLDKSGVYKSPGAPSIARFDFVKKGQSGYEHLSCYQAPQGVIRAKVAYSKNLDGKRVLFGNRGKFQFALWSQNGQDYLFVTTLSQAQLEAIVSST